MSSNGNVVKSTTKIIRNNYAWVIACLTFCGVIILNLLKFIEYLTSLMYFSYFGLDHNLYDYSSKNFIFEICCSMIFMFMIFSVFYCCKQILDNYKKHNLLTQETFWDIVLIIISNIFMVSTINELNLVFLLIYVAFLTVVEFILSFLVFKEPKISIEKDFRKEFINFIKVLPFFIIFFIIFNFAITYLDLMDKKQYRIISDDMVIVYSTNDYCLTLECSVNNDKLIIYKGTQEKIDNFNVKSRLKDFDKVIIEWL